LDHGNFFKVVDTLEKFQESQLNTDSAEGRDFLVFKNQLYQIYEVKNRSIHEHESFSFALERANLKWLYEANIDYIREINKVSHLEQMADTGVLKGKIFKAKILTPSRVKGIASIGASIAAYKNLTMLTLMLGPMAPVAAIVGTAVYGMNQFAEQESISTIEHLENGNLSLKINKTPLVSYTITCHQNDIMSVCSIGDDDMGADDVDSNILHVTKYTNSEGEVKQDGIYSLPADAYRDKQMMEWIMASKDQEGEATLDDFNDLMHQKFEGRVSAGGLNLLSSFNAKQTGFANTNSD
jgi:hypothetical protein